MLSWLAARAIRRPRRVALTALVAFVVFVVLGGPAAGALNAGNDFEDPGAPSAHARTQIERATGVAPSPSVLVLVDAARGAPAVERARRTLEDAPGIARATVTASRGDVTLVAATLRADADQGDVVSDLDDAFAARHDVTLGGPAFANEQVGEQAREDLAFAELLAFPLLALLAVLIFRGVAALLPLAVGAASVFGAFTVLRGVNEVFPLSVFCLNLVIGAGLGLAIDYSLFLVSRFREEVGRGADVAAAVRTTMSTAGRTVAYSAVTVAAAMASLLVFPLRFLQSMGLGGAIVALVAGTVALTLLPALFVLLGPRLGKVRPKPAREGGWYRFAHAVMRRPGLIALTTAAALALVALPALRAQWTGVDASILPTSKSARVVQDRLEAELPARDTTAFVAAISAPRAAAPQVRAYAERVARVDGVTGVARPVPAGTGTWIVGFDVRGESIGDVAQNAVTAVRGLPAPFPVALGGPAAQFHDQLGALGRKLPLALVLLATSTLLLLWLMTGSVVLPLKSLLMNALSVGAATGLLVLIFQDGRLTGPLAYTSQGGLESADFLVLAAIAFALSTDYGVFLLTRVKEGHDAGLDDREAVAIGLQRTGGIITAAAVLLAVAIGVFATSKVVFLKEIGVGTAAAVLLDAFVVRTLLVPSLMAMLGRWNWWSPGPLRRLHERLERWGLGEHAQAPA
jgi:uncharacterized membrane protein YdfJ with MMPL/SSD domain